MKTLICPTCGCSLVRLGVSTEQAVPHRYNGEAYHFCCQGCVDLFITAPETYLQNTHDVIVCPSCLGEKPRQRAVTLNVAGQDVYFCGCPSCTEAFQKNPDFYVQRLAGTIPNEGVRDHEGGSIRPA